MNDDFEKRLQQVAPREIPSAWREEILTAAQQVETAPRQSPVTRRSLLSALIYQLSILTRPQRAAWSGLAAAWVLIAGLNLASREASSPAIAKSAAPSPEALIAWRRQYHALATLTESSSPRPIITPPKPPISQPRSQRRAEWLTT